VYQGAAPAYPVNNNPRGTEFGRVSNIEVLQSRGSGQTSGGGAVLGAVVGGLLGNQVGKGSGRAAATAVGVIGGAVAGNAIEGRNNSGDYVEGYRISVQLDHGGYRVYDVSSPGDLRIGDRVRLYNGQISRQ
jgi:outer membrane lipoprotein SlyB